MADINVRVNPGPTVSARVGVQNAVKVVSSGSLANSLNELRDVDTDNLNDKYILMYNEVRGLYEFVNPDDLLAAASTEPISPGFPDEFIEQLNESNIDVDGGTY